MLDSEVVIGGSYFFVLELFEVSRGFGCSFICDVVFVLLLLLLNCGEGIRWEKFIVKCVG